MSSKRARRILEFLRGNIANGVETLQEGRRFIRQLPELMEDERLFVECTLKDDEQIRELQAASPPHSG